MKKLLTILAAAIVLSSCEKPTCWKCDVFYYGTEVIDYSFYPSEIKMWNLKDSKGRLVPVRCNSLPDK